MISENNTQKTNKIKVFTAFSGYDSQCLALKRLKDEHPDFDYELVGWSEIEPNAIKAHNILFPEAADKNLGDIAKIDWTQVPDFDLFTYSSPCTDFSLAGSLSGGEEGSGTRSSLLWECRRCIEAKRPKYLLLENVQNLVSKRFFDLFCKWIDTVNAFGYESFWTTLNAKDFGVPQNRERVFLVSIRKDSEEEKISFNFPKPLKVKPDVKDIYEKQVSSEYDIDYKKMIAWVANNQQKILEYISERNNMDISEIEITNPENISIIYKSNTQESDMQKKKNNLTEEEQQLLEEQEAERELESAELSDFDDSFKPTVLTEEEKRRPVKPVIEYLTEEDKKIRGNDKCIKIIPTPTRSDGSAPTLMATGYQSADYKNFYSVGHFPKLGVFEVWHHNPKKLRKKTNKTETPEETSNTNTLI